MKNCTASFIRNHFISKPINSGILVFILAITLAITPISAEEPADSLLRLFKSGNVPENEKALICAKLGEQYLAFKVDSALLFAWNGL